MAELTRSPNLGSLVYQTSLVRLLEWQSCSLRTEPRYMVLGATLWPRKQRLPPFLQADLHTGLPSRNPFSESSLPSQFPKRQEALPHHTLRGLSHPISQHRRSGPLAELPSLAEKLLIGKEEGREVRRPPPSPPRHDSRQLGLRASWGSALAQGGCKFASWRFNLNRLLGQLQLVSTPAILWSRLSLLRPRLRGSMLRK